MVISDLYLLQRSADFHLRPRQEEQIDLALKKIPPIPCTILCGVVLGICGPLAKATVKVLLPDGTPFMHTTTDRNGRFVFKNQLPPGCYRVIAVADKYRVSQEYHVSLLPSDSVDIVIRLRLSDLIHRATVYGMVRDQNGKALSLADIHICELCSDKKLIATSRSNGDGEYLVYGLKPGKYQITAKKSGYIFYQPAIFQCDPNEILPLDLFLYVDGCLQEGTVSGKITDCGKPVPHAVVGLYREECGTHTLVAVKEANDEGIYLFGNVSPGKYLVKAKLEDGIEFICKDKTTDQKIKIPETEEDVSVTL